MNEWARLTGASYNRQRKLRKTLSRNPKARLPLIRKQVVVLQVAERLDGGHSPK